MRALRWRQSTFPPGGRRKTTPWPSPVSSCASNSDLRRCTQGNQAQAETADRPPRGWATWVTPSPRRVRFPALLPAPSRKPPPCWGYLRHFPMSSPNTAGVCTTSGGLAKQRLKTPQQYVGPLNSFTPTPTNYSEPHHSKCLLAPLFTKDFARFLVLDGAVRLADDFVLLPKKVRPSRHTVNISNRPSDLRRRQLRFHHHPARD